MIENDFKQLNFSILGKEASLEGDLKFQGDTILNCFVKGTVTMSDKSKLTLERGSHIEGVIYCHDIEIFGSFFGTINASGTLSVRSSAEVSGKVNANQMSIYPGAQINFEGNTTLQDSQPKA